MKRSISWEEYLEGRIRSTSARYLTLDQFDDVIDEVLKHSSCPLVGLQYAVQCPTPFRNFEVGRPSDGDADKETYALQDNRNTSVCLQQWRRETRTGGREKTNSLLEQLFRSFWKPKLRTDPAGMLDLKKGGDEANSLAQRTLELHLDAGQPCVVFCSDLDNFKEVNETMSYEEGDRVIREFGALLEELAGHEAIILEYGGDEFVILRPHSSAEEAVMLAYRISEKIEEHDFKVGDIRIGLSTGLVFVQPSERVILFKECLAEAEKALKQHVKKVKKGRARFLPGTPVESKALEEGDRLNLAQCIVKSDLLSQCPFANVWLNCLSQVAGRAVNGKQLELDQIRNAFDALVNWSDVDIVGISETRSILPSELGFDGTPRISPIDMSFALAHGLLRGTLLDEVEDLYSCSLLMKYSTNGMNSALYIKRKDAEDLVLKFGDEENLAEEYDIGSFWISGLQKSEELAPAARAILIQIGHQGIGLPESIFAERIIVDDRPTRGGGLPDFWELTVAKVVAQTLGNPNIDVVYVMGNHAHGAKTVEKLRNVSEWSDNSADVAYKTALEENSIREASSRLQGKIHLVKDKEELVLLLADQLRQRHSLRPMRQVPRSSMSRFLQRDLDMREMGLTQKDGCRVSTIAQAYPLVLEIARKTEDETVIKDQAGQRLRELVDFKVCLQEPEQDMVPAFYEKDKGSLEDYYERVFETQPKFFGDIFKETRQYDAVLKHVADIVRSPQLQFATRRAILVVPHQIDDGEDISPLGLVSVRIVPRFSRSRIDLNYSYTWRTVEALVGFPYSLYGSVRFAQHLTEKLKGMVQPEVARRIYVGHVSYIAHSLHFFVDEYGQNIARKIIDDASI